VFGSHRLFRFVQSVEAAAVQIRRFAFKDLTRDRADSQIRF
jgi:hypothetical protein